MYWPGDGCEMTNPVNTSGPDNTGLTPRRSRALASLLDNLLRTKLWVQIVIAMIAGISLGIGLSPSGGAWISASAATIVAGWVALPGHLFLALIQMIVVPLIISSIILGIAGGGNVDFVRRIGLRIGPYFVATTIAAVAIGASLAIWVAPGDYIDTALVAGAGTAEVAAPVVPAAQADPRPLPEQIVAIIPANPGSAILQRSMFQIVVLAILIAVALVSIKPERARPILDLCVSLQELAMKIVSWAMALAPAAVFGLLAKVSIELGMDALFGMAIYITTVVAGLALLIVMYLAIVTLLARRNPWHFLQAIREVQLLAFSTSSSAAVMPLSMQTASEGLQVRSSVARFIVPLGATVNMDGTALYQIVAAVFLAQVYGIELSLAQLTLLAATTVGASIGSPSTPGVGIVILATIVAGIGVPPAGIALIIGVDRILDMCRTAVNVTGDLTACVVMDRWLPDDEVIAEQAACAGPATGPSGAPG